MEEKKETGKHTAHHEHPHEHPNHEHHEMKIDNDPDKINFSKVKTNPWMIVSGILAVAVIVLLVLMFTGTGIAGQSVSGKVAGDNVVKFAQAQGLEATVQKVSDMGAFYEVNLSMNGQDFPVYVTKDGKKMATGLIPLADTGANTGNTNTNTPSTPTQVT